jgi:RNA helicase armi
LVLSQANDELGPVVLSQIVGDYGLEESYLKRVFSKFPYIRDSQSSPKTCGYDSRLITKLIYNYRSLPDLLKLPSVLFYNDDLKPTVSHAQGVPY